MATPYEESVSYSPTQSVIGFSPIQAQQEFVAQDKSMAQLAQFSKTLGDELYKFQQQVNKDQMMEGYNLALSEPNPIDVSNEIKSAGEQLKADEMDANEVAFDIIKSGESPEVAQAVQNMSGWKRYGYAKAKAELAGAGWESYLSGQISDNGERSFYHPETGEQFTLADTATDPALRAYAIAEMRKDYLEENGLTLMKPAFLNEFAGKQFRSGQDKFVEEARKARIVQRGQEISNQADTEVAADLDLNKYFSNKKVSYNDKGKLTSLGEAWTDLTDILKDKQQLTNRPVDVSELRNQPIIGDPKGRTYGDLYRAKLDGLEADLDTQYRTIKNRIRTDNSRSAKDAVDIIIEGCKGNPAACTPDKLQPTINDINSRYGVTAASEAITHLKNNFTNYVEPDEAELARDLALADEVLDRLDMTDKYYNSLPEEVKENPQIKQQYEDQKRIEAVYGELISGNETAIKNAFASPISGVGIAAAEYAADVIVAEQERFRRGLVQQYRNNNQDIGGWATNFVRELQTNMAEGRKVKGNKYYRDRSINNPFPYYFGETGSDAALREDFREKYDKLSPGGRAASKQELLPKETLQKFAKVLQNDPFLMSINEESNSDLHKVLEELRLMAASDGSTVQNILHQTNSMLDAPVDLPPVTQISRSAANQALGGSLLNKFMNGTLTQRQSERVKAILKYPTYNNPNLTEQEQAVVNIIGKHESDSVGGYDAVNQGGTDEGRTVVGYSGPFSQMSQHGGRQLTDLTVGEIMDLQYDDKSLTMEQWKQQGKLHAVGRYQFVGSTFAEVVNKMGISKDELFSQELQDRMCLFHFKEKGYGPWVGVVDNASQTEKMLLNRARF